MLSVAQEKELNKILPFKVKNIAPLANGDKNIEDQIYMFASNYFNVDEFIEKIEHLPVEVFSKGTDDDYWTKEFNNRRDQEE